MASVALLHAPCVDKNGEEIATAITNLDLHDLARVCLTYGMDTLYIVHPYQVQRDFAQKIMQHWLSGHGATYNPLRKKAFELVRLAADLDEVKEQTQALIVATSARRGEKIVSWPSLRGLAKEQDICLTFGTGWGLADRILKEVDVVVEPIDGIGDFNHLSVRAAAAIALDRIFRR